MTIIGQTQVIYIIIAPPFHVCMLQYEFVGQGLSAFPVVFNVTVYGSCTYAVIFITNYSIGSSSIEIDMTLQYSVDRSQREDN